MSEEGKNTERNPARVGISFLVPHVASSSLGFATSLAQALASVHPVQIVAPDMWGGLVSDMYRNTFDYTIVPAKHMYRFPEYCWDMRRIGRATTGDILFAIKAFPQTVRAALLEKKRRGCRVVICLDEWDGALMAMRSSQERRRFWRKNWMHPIGENYIPFVERLFPKADAILSTSTFLQKKFGGELIRQGVDTTAYAPPSAADQLRVRTELGLSSADRVIVFGGVVRPHKGVEQILSAITKLNDPRIKLLVVGGLTEDAKRLMGNPEYATRMQVTGGKPKEEMPYWLGAGDLTILPMRNTLLAQSQVPCKIFEAMSMGIPVIAGAVSDLPDILSGVGEVYPPEDENALVEILRRWLDQPERFQKMGLAARKKCLDQYSDTIMQSSLLELVERLSNKSHPS